MRALRLENRSVLRLVGKDSGSFLQGLVTNDVNKAKAGQAVYAAMLTPQGKFLFDMIIIADEEDLLLDVEAGRKDDMIRRLTMYKMRADVTITDEPYLSVWAVWGHGALDGIAVSDPRHADLGMRLITDISPDCTALALADYEKKRLQLGVPDGSRDMMVDKYFWLETDAERLNGVSFSKGCYVGQELTARMKHRTNLKKKLVPIMAEGGTLSPELALETEDGKSAGDIRSADGQNAIAYLRLEFADVPLKAGDISVRVLVQ